MKFSITNEKIQHNKILTYSPDELSFDMEPAIKEVNFYVLINNIELSVDENNFVVQLSGFSSHELWIKNNCLISEFKEGLLKIEDYFDSGFSYRFNEKQWPVYSNFKEGWICIGNPEITNEGIEFLPNCIAILNYGELKALWLKPVFLKEV